MQIQQTTYGNLHRRTQDRFPELEADTQVFVARNGSRIAGTAYVQHSQITVQGQEDRELQLTVDASNDTVRSTLVSVARDATKRFKRRFRVN